MESFDHPFLIKLAATFQDDYSVFMVLGLAQGGELYQYIQKQPRYRLGKDSVQFYTACTLEGLHHLHSRKVCHRDIKPENILIGNDGYCIIIDMGFAKVVEDKTFTLVSALMTRYKCRICIPHLNIATLSTLVWNPSLSCT